MSVTCAPKREPQGLRDEHSVSDPRVEVTDHTRTHCCSSASASDTFCSFRATVMATRAQNVGSIRSSWIARTMTLRLWRKHLSSTTGEPDGECPPTSWPADRAKQQIAGHLDRTRAHGSDELAADRWRRFRR